MSAAPAHLVHLVRHCDAGDRTRYSGDDLERPLSAKGRRQALVIADRLAARVPSSLVSSAARRCIETLEPLALATGLELRPEKALLEGEPAGPALEFVLALAARERESVLCSHGDVLVGVVDELLSRGVAVAGTPSLAKGAVVELRCSPAGKALTLTFVGKPDLRGC